MRISSVLLENIKKFNSKEAIFNFGSQPGMYTVSGGNGSGKTAIFRSIQIFQKIFFFDQIGEDDVDYPILKEKLWRDLDGLLAGESGLIDIAFRHEDFSFGIELKITKDHSSWGFTFKAKTPDALEHLREHWDIRDPKNIVAYIDASKSFSDFGVRFDDITLLPRRERNRRFILDCVFEPEKTLQSIYRKAVIDHVQYRIDPSRTYQYFKNANAAIKAISGNIEVANISATKLDGQLVIVGRTSKDATLFDIKDFSSGERALYLTLLFLYYLPNIGVLIIDEPENHLHESLLSGFYDFLHNFLDKGIGANLDSPKEGAAAGESVRVTSVFEQIFLTTHSKALIYKNMEHGQSFAMAGNAVQRISSSDVERELRASGISTVYARTLFVEGSTDASLMADFFTQLRIKVAPVNSCKEVVSYFEKIAAIRHEIHGAAFCFVIDSDNRTEEELLEIKRLNPEFYEQSFCVIPAHEVENLFIDEQLIFDAISPFRAALGLEELSMVDIKNLMAIEADGLKEQSLRKYLASGLKLELKKLVIDPITDIKLMKSRGIMEAVNDAFSSRTATDIINATGKLEEQFEILWQSDWKKYVDGKAFMGMLRKKLSEKSDRVSTEKIKDLIYRRIKDEPMKYAFGRFMQDVVKKFNDQGGI